MVSNGSVFVVVLATLACAACATRPVGSGKGHPRLARFQAAPQGGGRSIVERPVGAPTPPRVH